MKPPLHARALLGLGFLLAFTAAASARNDTIKIGILHSLSGTMAISESVLKDTVLMLVEDQNRKGGVLGRKLEPVVVDPASNWDLFAEQARDLLTREKVAVVFGGWTSASRKAVLPVFEQSDGLLFYPVQYEGGRELARCVLHGSHTQSASHSRGPVSDQQGRRKRSPMGPAWHRRRVSPHDQPDLQRLLGVTRGCGRGHHYDAHAVWLFRLA